MTCSRCGWVFTPRDRYCWRCYITAGAKAVTIVPTDCDLANHAGYEELPDEPYEPDERD